MKRKDQRTPSRRKGRGRTFHKKPTTKKHEALEKTFYQSPRLFLIISDLSNCRGSEGEWNEEEKEEEEEEGESASFPVCRRFLRLYFDCLFVLLPTFHHSNGKEIIKPTPLKPTFSFLPFPIYHYVDVAYFLGEKNGGRGLHFWSEGKRRHNMGTNM